MYYAIEIVGYGKRQRYCIKKVINKTSVDPFNGKWYATEMDAKQAAKQAGIEIKCIGDLWQIIKDAK